MYQKKNNVKENDSKPFIKCHSYYYFKQFSDTTRKEMVILLSDFCFPPAFGNRFEYPNTYSNQEKNRLTLNF